MGACKFGRCQGLCRKTLVGAISTKQYFFLHETLVNELNRSLFSDAASDFSNKDACIITYIKKVKQR